MKVLYDYQTFQFQTFGGISRYFVELMRLLESNHKLDINLPRIYSKNSYIKQLHLPKGNVLRAVEYKDFFPNSEFKGKWSLFCLLEKWGVLTDGKSYNQVSSAERIKLQDFDIFHPTYYETYFLEHIGSKPFVLTVHDMIHEALCESVPTFNVPLIQQKKELIERCSKIIAVSESTKQAIIKMYNTEADKIRVVHHGNSMNPADGLTVTMKLPQKYVLYVGRRDFYKNFDCLIRSLAPLLKKDKDFYLICAGGAPLKDNEVKQLKTFDVENKVLYYDIDDNRLVQLYSHAQAFIFPSLYEGFGIPILEAFACGCPVLLNDIAVFHEVAEDAAIYFKADNEESTREAVLNIINDDQLKCRLKKDGGRRLACFSWEKTAESTYEVYKEL